MAGAIYNPNRNEGNVTKAKGALKAGLNYIQQIFGANKKYGLKLKKEGVVKITRETEKKCNICKRNVDLKKESLDEHKDRCEQEALNTKKKPTQAQPEGYLPSKWVPR